MWDKLIALYRADRRFQAMIAQDLHPLWKSAGSPDLTIFDAQAWAAEEASDAYRAYARAVIDAVRSMRLFERPLGGGIDGRRRELRPSMHAATEVHITVMAWPSPVTWAARAVDYLEEKASIQITVVTTGGRVRMTATGERGIQSDETVFDASVDEIATQVHDALSAWIADVRRRVRRRYPHYNAGTIDQFFEAIDPLFTYLYHGRRPEDDAEQKRLRRLANMIYLTLPPPGRT